MTLLKSRKIRFADFKKLDKIKILADLHRHEIGFVNRSVIIDAIKNQEILYQPYGFLHFHHRKDRISTLYHICVDPKYRKLGIGRQLVQVWETYSRNCNIRKLRLKCPINLPSNGFYAHLGFCRVGIEQGRKRSLIIWEKNLLALSPIEPRFFASLSAGGRDLEFLDRLWKKGKDPRKPFDHVLYSPISCPPSTTEYLRFQKIENNIQNVWLDCGAYQVQQGKINYADLLDFLESFYTKNQWADGYVLPDIVPLSTDNKNIIECKVQETIYHCTHFFNRMPDRIKQQAIAPVQGRTISHITRCIEAYSKIGVKRVGFGSWGTAGPNGSVNMLSQPSLHLFSQVLTLAQEYGMEVHCFGIGGPNSFNRLIEDNLVPHSLDSTTWWKAGGFGSVFFPNTSQIQVTVRRGLESTKIGLENLKKKTGHSCYFCRDIEKLRTNRNYRIMHNLAAWLDTLEI